MFVCLQLGSPQQKPKRLRVLADVSGSMYRFNGVDGRLERSMEAVCMVMEALENYEHKFKVRLSSVLLKNFFVQHQPTTIIYVFLAESGDGYQQDTHYTVYMESMSHK